MAEIKNPEPRFKVNIIESERGWGQKIDEVKYFTTEKSAKDFCRTIQECPKMGTRWFYW